MRNLSELMGEEDEEKKKMKKMGSATSTLKFVGWSNPPKDWEPWVRKLCSLHQSTWKNAGIYEAVMSSIYAIKRHDKLILELVSRWCSQTNTFVFPWGEATLTLEDMLILGGFSALGISALMSLENDLESLKIKERLEVASKEIQMKSCIRQTNWMEKFIGSGNDLEHAAFLSLWLSRFVFPMRCSPTTLINKHVFPIAARLSRGIKIALGPAVLAMLYRELTALNKRLRFTLLDRPIDLCPPFHLVQVWAWERFSVLRPVPDGICSGENFPRLARWSNVEILKDNDLKPAIDSSKKAFLWCPYGAFARREERDPETFARCIKSSELVGFDSCIERYDPQCVARQFGSDQEILNVNVDKTTDCNTSSDVKFLATSATFQPTITGCYEKCRKQQRCSTSSQMKVENKLGCGPPGFPPQIEGISIVDYDSDNDCRVIPSPIASPGVAVEVKDICSVHKIEASESADKQQTFPITSAEIKLVCNDGQLVQPQHSNLVSPTAGNEAMEVVNGSVHETREDEGGVADTKHDAIDGMEGRSTGFLATNCDADSYRRERFKNSGLDLEARISRLENIVYGHIKALQPAM